MSRRATILTVLLVAGAAPAVPHATAACTGVRTRGPWTVVDAPAFADVGANGTAYDVGPIMHVMGKPYGYTMPGGSAARTFVSNGVRLMRTTDGGCSWQRTYSIDARDATDALKDPLVAAIQGHAEYTVTAHATRSLAPGARPGAVDPVYVLLGNQDGWLTGIPLNAAGQPYYMARSLDGGATWQTSLLQARLDGVSSPVPVLGNGNAADIAVSPADARTAFLLVDTRDPRGVDASKPAINGALYVTRDAGATWTYVMPLEASGALDADPADPNVVYLSANGNVEALTVAPKPSRRLLFTMPLGETRSGFDVVHVARKPAQFLVTAIYRDQVLKVAYPVVYRSTDAARTWQRMAYKMGGVLTGVGAGFVGGTAWLTASGDVVAVVSNGAYGATIIMVSRWDARKRAWRKAEVQQLPLGAAFTSVSLAGMVPVDTGHRWFSFWGSQSKPGGAYASIVGVYDSGR